MGIRRIDVYYYNGHNYIGIDRHVVKHMEKDENYIIIVAEEIDDEARIEHYRYTYSQTRVIKMVEKI